VTERPRCLDDLLMRLPETPSVMFPLTMATGQGISPQDIELVAQGKVLEGKLPT
jgi:hypothetical protein